MGGYTPARHGGFRGPLPGLNPRALFKKRTHLWGNTPGRVMVVYQRIHATGNHPMWLRNLLFLGLVVVGVIALGVNLMPPREPKPVTGHDASAYQAPDFRAAVEAVDASFRRQWAEQKLKT